jgi:uncharacterized repeat protein (TIGR03803 family)
MQNYKTIRFVLCAALLTAAAADLPAQTFTTLYTFSGVDGEFPGASLVQGADGDLYGITRYGGAANVGTIFKITTGGTLTTLYSFCSQTNCTDGQNPEAMLAQGANGDFYGTTFAGGRLGVGTVFKLAEDGKLTTLHSFAGGADGRSPSAGLVLASDGDFYGTTAGAISYTGANSAGTIFRITQGGTLTTLYHFCSQGGKRCTDGESPYTGLVQGTNGDLYGTTSYGGANGLGTIFGITLSGTLTTLYSFCFPGCAGGSGTLAALVEGTDGDLYGTGIGTVFKITPAGTYSTLLNFGQAIPSYGALVLGTDGNFYGTTLLGGGGACGSTLGCGFVFDTTSSGTLTQLYDFCPQTGCLDGYSPLAGLVQATDGNFYGVTYYGGANNYGTIFSLSTGLGRFVKTSPTSGKVGTSVRILGTDLTGATSVAFHGTAAAFTVVSASEITATVPAGATTGKIQVVTPGGTLLSNVSFRVP